MKKKLTAVKKTYLIISFGIIAVGFGMSLHRSLTGNGLLDENLDTHILAQLDGAGDDTGGDDTGGGETGGDKTGGDETGKGPYGPDSLYYMKQAYMHREIKSITATTNNQGEVTVIKLKLYDYKKNTTYTFSVVDYSCRPYPNSGNFCDYRQERTELLSFSENNGNTPSPQP